MTPASVHPGPPSATAPTAPVVTSPLPCVRCGYALQGLRLDALCPECAGPVARSLHGDLLRYADPAYVQTLRRGAQLAEAGVVGMLLMIIGGAAWMIWDTFAGSRSGRTLATVMAVGSVVGLACAVLTLVGWFLLSAPDPARLGADAGVTSRKALRAALAAGAAAWLGLAGLSTTAALASLPPGAYRPLQTGLWIAAGASVLAQLLAAAVYARTLGARLTEPPITRDASRLLWSTLALAAAAALTSVLILTGIARRSAGLSVGAFLVAYVLFTAVAAKYANVLDLVRKGLGRIAREQAVFTLASRALKESGPFL